MVLHDLRYLLAFGSDANAELAHRGHDYLALATPILGVLAALASARFFIGLATGMSVDQRARGFRSIWAAATLALLAIYSAQELAEGALASGHPAGLDALLDGNGWVAAPLALVIAAVVARAVVGLRSARSFHVVRLRRELAAPVADAGLRVLVSIARRRPRLLAERFAGRAPPAITV